MNPKPSFYNSCWTPNLFMHHKKNYLILQLSKNTQKIQLPFPLTLIFLHILFSLWERLHTLHPGPSNFLWCPYECKFCVVILSKYTFIVESTLNFGLKEDQHKPQRIMQLTFLPSLAPISFLDNEVLQRGCRPPSRKEAGRERATAPWFCLLLLKDIPAVSYTRGGAVAALSTWKTHQQGWSNRKVKTSGFWLVFFLLPRERLLYNVKSTLPHSR